ncbi:MAG: hypothetical protein ACK5BX_09325, partial [Bradyrhizobium sp.]
PAAASTAAAFGDVLIEQARQLVAIGFARRRFADDSLEFLDDRLNARSRNVAAGERRADDGADADTPEKPMLQQFMQWNQKAGQMERAR